ncbi:MAG: manganese efflux pump MntP family protein [Candidatus Eisenbacteria bacterium]
MQTVEIVLIAFALSIDAFVVALAAAASGRIENRRAALRMSFHFGLFQALMPVLGWAAGATLERVISVFDHWVAFALLAVIGARMIHAGCKGEKVPRADDPSRGLTLVALCTAVSIDALAVGLSLAMLGVAIWVPSAIIGITTLVVSFVGAQTGGRLQARLGRAAELAGGLILIAIAVRIVLSHMA